MSIREVEPQSRSRYQVITTLGQGGMARVLLTMSRGPAGVTKLLVVKELKDELKSDPEFVTMFLDEARIAARLNHPNVIQTYEVSSDGEHPIIVMEYLEGQSLSAVLGRVGRKNISLDLHLHVLAQVAAGLHYAHELRGFDGDELGLVHRDVSPHNVFVTYDGLVKLVDFGIAKAADSAGLTRAGVFKGKIGYAAPEQLGANANVDRRADVFALGVMLWEAIAQRRLSYGEPEAAVMHRRLGGKDTKIDEVAPDAPEELRRICNKAMAPDPADRHATAAELRAAIEGFLESSRRIGAEDLGSLVRQTFAADREKVRLLVEAEIKAIKALSTTGEHSAPSLRTPDLTPVRRDPSEPRDSTVKAAASEALPPSSGPSLGRNKVIVAAAAAALLALALVATASRTGAPSAASASSPAMSAEPAPAATVEVWIAAEPPEARIFLDDTPLAQNPFRGVMPRSALTRKLRVSAPGFGVDERFVKLDRDLRLELALKAAPSASAVASAATAPSSTGTSAAAQPRPVAAPPPAPAPKPGSPAPGEALTGPQQKKTRSIDDTF